MKVDERLVPLRREAVHTVEVDGEAVLLDEDSGRFHLLNATGALLWVCFDGASSIGEIVTDISDELGTPRELVLADTLAIVRHLASEGLLANVEPAPRKAGAGAPVETHLDPPTAKPTDSRFVPEPPNT